MEHSKPLIISLLLCCVALFSHSAVITPPDKTAQQEILSDMQCKMSHMRAQYDVLSEIARIRAQFDDITDTAISVVNCPGNLTPLSRSNFAIIYNYMFHCWNEDLAEGFFASLWHKFNSEENLANDLFQYCSILGDDAIKSMFKQIIYDVISIDCEEFVYWLIANRNKTVRYSDATDTLKRLIPRSLYDVFTSPLLSNELEQSIKENSLEFNIGFID